eukprot:CAMPEP_0184305312 /NCGR_PEP_ID=MMETSP1049-20130417/14625_1 /TAXON_ID=77928 /ORGANISM="Proteomonas sulcata, Strain CCMP704" /LENGTH=433 /DNA_ID=CAMNT_0026617353 /DNA_START=61 /DNA_END=1362 /DNA_ORIENTATION=-
MAFTGFERTSKLKCLQYLVEEHFVDPLISGQDHRSPLHVAVCEVEILRYLIFELGANVNAIDEDGRTPLHHAAMFGKLECLIYLIGEGEADTTVKDKYGKLACDYDPDVIMLTKKKPSLKRVTNFFRGAIVDKCFWLWKKYRIDVHDLPPPPPSLEERRTYRLPTTYARTRLYRRWIKDQSTRPPFVDEQIGWELDDINAYNNATAQKPRAFRAGGVKDFDSNEPQNVDEKALDVNMHVMETGHDLSLTPLVVDFDGFFLQREGRMRRPSMWSDRMSNQDEESMLFDTSTWTDVGGLERRDAAINMAAAERGLDIAVTPMSVHFDSVLLMMRKNSYWSTFSANVPEDYQAAQPLNHSLNSTLNGTASRAPERPTAGSGAPQSPNEEDTDPAGKHPVAVPPNEEARSAVVVTVRDTLKSQPSLRMKTSQEAVLL